jgi:radical SAM-linked protein
METPQMRFKITFEKTAAMRYTSHLDLQRTWERTLRRARVPLAYSQGFSPHPKINLGAALPLGFTSQAEIIEVWLDEQWTLKEFESALTPALPPGLAITNIEETELRSPKVQNLIHTTQYTVDLREPRPEMSQQVDRLMESQTLIRERRKKQYDLRPLIKTLAASPDGGQIEMSLSALPGATGRPDEVLLALGINPHEVNVTRTAILLEN